MQYLDLISHCCERNLILYSHKTFYLLLKDNLKRPPSIKFNTVAIKRNESVCYLELEIKSFVYRNSR